MADGPVGVPERQTTGRSGTPEKMSPRLKIRRYNPEIREGHWWDEFEVRMQPNDRLLDALHEVKWRHDGTLALRRSCAHAHLRLGRDHRERPEPAGLQGAGEGRRARGARSSRSAGCRC